MCNRINLSCLIKKSKEVYVSLKKFFYLAFYCIIFVFCLCGCGENKSFNSDTATLPENVGNDAGEASLDITSIDLSKYNFDNINLAIGSSYKLEELSAEEIICTSEKEEIATISENCEIVAKSEGRTNINISAGNQEKQFEVCVTNPQINITEANKIVGNTVLLMIYGTTSEVKWKSDNEAIATVEDGLVYAMPTGCGMSTDIHAYVDGKDLVCEINVEPIPQLDTTYKIFSEGERCSINEGEHLCNLTAYSNTNKVIHYTKEQIKDLSLIDEKELDFEEVLNLNKVDYSDGRTFPVYETHLGSNSYADDYTHIEIYLVGTSQKPNILTKDSGKYNIEVSYEAKEGYGIISVWLKHREIPFSSQNAGIVYLEVDGLEYCFNVYVRGRGINSINSIPHNYLVEEYTENDIVEVANSGDYSKIIQGSYTFMPGDLGSELGEKFVGALQDKAVSVCVDLLFAALFHI